MSSFEQDFDVVRSGAVYLAELVSHWDIFTPNGGYLAAVAYAAMDAEKALPIPASFHCHYLRSAVHGACEIAVEALRRSRTAEVLRATLSQNGKPVLIATASLLAENVEGFEHRFADYPAPPRPDALESYDTLAYDIAAEPVYWRNVDMRPVRFRHTPDPFDPVYQAWLRLKAAELPLSDRAAVARLLLWADLAPYSSLAASIDWANRWVAPNLDLYVQFHALPKTTPWLLIDGVAPIASRGLVGATTRIWDEEGRLVATSASQLICRPNPFYTAKLAWLEAYRKREAEATTTPRTDETLGRAEA
ncbi:MAG: thioesterase family protein [Methylocystis sp.]|uniref:thioesterase family protein n=1 Tax=Phenylobacterium sp. TaxID=1871053 RepID=UPI0025D68C05|nr:thioesterase family protein [Phenylobacterium sp.]MCA3585159.1 thioesterase family protein [Methylocystis sp.]MCA6286262.1 thioesterase family protein [Phenylobacterium sp.]MCA6289318.1 thioesterase family protein [Phenylobacterium sp.]MCA6346644.1 thioesterase family protein [Phenylobacterium sp.]MCA6349240.1 thioesterase family protein [Phenylobacterium sp.]